MMEPRRYQWVLALVFAIVAHLAVAQLLAPPAPIELNDPGIRLSLGGAGPGGSTGPADAIESIGADAIPTTTLVEAAAIQAVGTAAVAAISEVIHAAEPAPPPPLAATEPVSPKPKAETVRTREPPPPQTARAAHKSKPETEARIKSPRPNAGKSAPVDANATGKVTGKQSTGGGAAASVDGAGGGATSGRADGGRSKDRYYAELAAWLERHKRYPAQARKMRQEGIVRVRFVIDRDGRVISHRIEASSGHSALDDAASELLRRASPMPAIPARMGQSRLEIVVPIAYRLR